MRVYVITDGDTCKIGITSDIEVRLTSMQTSNPRRLTVAFSIQCKNSRIAYRVEARAHKNLSSVRMSGEWFKCDVSVATAAICEAVLDVAASDFSYIDMPRGGELALSSRGARYVQYMCKQFGMKKADVVDEALVEYFGPIIDGNKQRKTRADRLEKHHEPRRIIVEALSSGAIPVSKLKTKKGLGTMREDVFRQILEDMADEGAITIGTRGRGAIIFGRQGERYSADTLAVE